MDYLEIAGRVLMAILAGGIIGFEREKKKKPAGFITHTLVCVGACIIAIIQILMAKESFDLAQSNPELIPTIKVDMGRLTAQVISGIGFLGAGTIIQTRDTVTGITTAATLWLVACLGIAVGMGYYFLVIFVLLSVSFVLVIMKKIEVNILERRKYRRLAISFLGEEAIENHILDYLHSKEVKVQTVKHLREKYTNGLIDKKSIYIILIPKYIKTEEIIKGLEDMKQITKISLL